MQRLVSKKTQVLFGDGKHTNIIFLSEYIFAALPMYKHDTRGKSIARRRRSADPTEQTQFQITPHAIIIGGWLGARSVFACLPTAFRFGTETGRMRLQPEM